MKKDKNEDSCCESCCNHHGSSYGSSESVVYAMGLIGAAFHFLPGSSGVNEWAWHLFQTIAWPGFLVFEALKYLGL